MRPVDWSARSKKSLSAIFDHLAQDSPQAALSVTQRIIAAGDALGVYSTGRPGPMTGTYLKSLTDLRYIIHYRIERRAGIEQVRILNIVHTSRNWRPPPPKAR